MRRKRSGSQELTEHPPSTSREPRGRSGTTEAFFRFDDGADSGPLLVVYHIQKTGGTSLRHVVRANLPRTEVEHVPNLPPSARTPPELLDWARTWYESLGDDRRARLCCVMSHWGGYLLPALDRPADALALVREPVDRTLSYYHFKQRRRGPERPLEPLEQLYENLQGDGSGPPLRRRGWEQFFNWQSRCLLSVFYDISELPATAGPPPDADLWRTRLSDLVDRIFVVGVQDRFEEYLDLLARRYGWTTFIPQSKVNPERPPVAEVPAGLRQTILANNWLDAELYELCGKAQDRRRAG